MNCAPSTALRSRVSTGRSAPGSASITRPPASGARLPHPLQFLRVARREALPSALTAAPRTITPPNPKVKCPPMY